MRIKIDDDFGIHSGFFLNLKPGYTPLVGPNGAGKTTLLRQLREYANGHGIMVFDYSNLVHGGGSAMDKYLWSGNMIASSSILPLHIEAPWTSICGAAIWSCWLSRPLALKASESP